MPGARRGVGLALVSDGESSKAWNVDVYTSWAVRKSLSLYGRLGYMQSEATTAYAPGFLTDALGLLLLLPPVRTLIIRGLAGRIRGIAVIHPGQRFEDEPYEHRASDDRLT